MLEINDCKRKISKVTKNIENTKLTFKDVKFIRLTQETVALTIFCIGVKLVKPKQDKKTFVLKFWQQTKKTIIDTKRNSHETLSI